MILTAADYETFRFEWRYQDVTDTPLYVEVLNYMYSETKEYDATHRFAKHQIIDAGGKMTITDEHRNPVQSEIDAFKQMPYEDQLSELNGIYDEIYRRIEELYEEDELNYRLSMAGL